MRRVILSLAVLHIGVVLHSLVYEESDFPDPPPQFDLGPVVVPPDGQLVVKLLNELGGYIFGHHAARHSTAARSDRERREQDLGDRSRPDFVQGREDLRRHGEACKVELGAQLVVPQLGRGSGEGVLHVLVKERGREGRSGRVLGHAHVVAEAAQKRSLGIEGGLDEGVGDGGGGLEFAARVAAGHVERDRDVGREMRAPLEIVLAFVFVQLGRQHGGSGGDGAHGALIGFLLGRQGVQVAQEEVRCMPREAGVKLRASHTCEHRGGGKV